MLVHPKDRRDPLQAAEVTYEVRARIAPNIGETNRFKLDFQKIKQKLRNLLQKLHQN